MKKLVVSGVMALIVVVVSLGVAQAQKESSKNEKNVIYVAAEQATFKQSPTCCPSCVWPPSLITCTKESEIALLEGVHS